MDMGRGGLTLVAYFPVSHLYCVGQEEKIVVNYQLM